MKTITGGRAHGSGDPVMTATTKKQAATKAVSESTWKKIRTAYLSTTIQQEDNSVRLTRELAQRFGIRLKDVEGRAWTWERERQVEASRAWYRDYGHGARTEAEFCARFTEHAAKDRTHTYAQLLAEVGPEARALLHATARELWWRIMAPVFEWEAKQQIELAQQAIEAIQNERNRLRRAGLYIDENEAEHALRVA